MTKEKSSPLAPTMAEAVGFNDRRVNPDNRSGSPKQGTSVAKGHSKGGADPSMGTATSRPGVLEAGGARFRVNPPHFAPNAPEAASTQSNGRIVPPTAAVHRDKTYDPSIESGFNDAPVIGGYAAGEHRLRGYTTKG